MQLTRPSAPIKQHSLSGLARQEEGWAYLFLLPSILGLVGFTVGPVIYSLVISFTEWDISHPPKFVGLANYVTLLTTDDTFVAALRNTTYYTFVAVPLGIVLALGLAIAMNQKIHGIVVYRALYFLPVITSGVATAFLWYWIYHPEYGIFNWFLAMVGIRGPRWLVDPHWAMPAIIIMAVWGSVGYSMTIYLAGLQGIDQSYYEAASIDGANWWGRFRHVTIPLISPTTFFLLILGVIGGFQVFVPMYVMTQGGPGNSTISILMYLFQNAFIYLHMGLASAIAYVLFIIIFVFTLIQLKLQSRWVHYE